VRKKNIYIFRDDVDSLVSKAYTVIRKANISKSAEQKRKICKSAWRKWNIYIFRDGVDSLVSNAMLIIEKQIFLRVQNQKGIFVIVLSENGIFTYLGMMLILWLVMLIS
jgi:hypothetical protein